MFTNFDANASCSLLPEVSETLRQLPTHALNPSAIHRAGQFARALIEEARDQVAQLLGTGRSERIIFTSGATESNNMVVLAPFVERLGHGRVYDPKKGAAVIASTVEHHAILEPIERLKHWNVPVTLVSPQADGSIDPCDFVNACGDNTTVVSLMLANNETGHIFPVQKVAQLIKEIRPQALVHSDAVQAVGKMPIRFAELGVDAISLSGHKLGALPGVGALVLSRSVPHYPLLVGGPQETRWRPGTENVHGIVSLGIAARHARLTLEKRLQAMQGNITKLKEIFAAKAAPLIINSPASGGLPNTLSVTFPGIRADDVIVALDLQGICVSAGSACSSGKAQVSHVLSALGISEDAARATLRFSLEPHYEAGQIEKAAEAVVAAITRAREVRL